MPTTKLLKREYRRQEKSTTSWKNGGQWGQTKLNMEKKGGKRTQKSGTEIIWHTPSVGKNSKNSRERLPLKDNPEKNKQKRAQEKTTFRVPRKQKKKKNTQIKHFPLVQKNKD